MRLEKIDLNLFVVLDALYRERSVSRVAITLNLTQPAVSNALNRLRTTFNDPLFVRAKGGVAPTPMADTVINDVRDALGMMKRSVELSVRFDPQTSDKTFRLGMSNLAESLLLPKLQAYLSEHAPNTDVTHYYVDRRVAAEELKSGMIDVLVDAPLLDPQELSIKPLSNLPYVVAMRPGHPLNKKDITLNDYLASEHIHVSSRRHGPGLMDIALHNIGHARTVKMRVQSYLVAAKVIEKSDLLWTVPKVLADSLNLQAQALPFSAQAMRWHMYWQKQAKDDPSNVWIRNAIESVVLNTV